MKSAEIIKLPEGTYELTDGIYSYTLRVGFNKDKSKFYDIIEKGSGRFSASIFMTEGLEKDEDGKKHRYLTASAGVGGLRIRSTDIFFMLSKLKIVKTGEI